MSGDLDSTIRMWDVSTGRLLAAVKDHDWPVVSIAWSPDGSRFVSGSHDGTTKVRSASTGRQLLRLEPHTGSVLGVAFAPDGQHIATVSRLSDAAQVTTIQLFDAVTGTKVKNLGDPNTNWLGAIAFSPKGRWLAAAADPVTTKIWEITTEREVFFCRSEGQLNSIAFSPDGQRLATGSGRGAKIWDTTSGAEVVRLREGQWVASVAFSPDGKRLATAGADPTVGVYEAISGKELVKLAGHSGALAAVTFSSDGKCLATASHDGTLKLWDANPAPNPRNFPQQTGEVRALAVSPDGTRMGIATSEGAIHVWEVSTNRRLFSIEGVTDVNRVVFSPDGARLATSNGWHARWGGDPAKIWDAKTGRQLLELKGNGFVAFAPDGLRIATGSAANNVTIWDAVGGRELLVLTGHSDFVQCGAFSPDGRRIVTACGDLSRGDVEGNRTLKIWDSSTGKELLSIKRYRPENDLSSTVAFSPDGTQVAFAGNDLTPRVWNARTGLELLALVGHIGTVTGVGYSSDGRRIVTASKDRSVKLWDASTGRELLTLEGHSTPVRAAVFTPNGRSIITADQDGLIKIWETASPEQSAAWKK